ncbi:hypothetical protein [Phascolarctobacterium succinatutens]|uniref:hypothetical protein n=1 Tax=Phascolarctobacterium succinatutens TaxID=626940 RepID=UPI0026E9279E|nr:hypothetical protein [Phascolarctobacterium succinatutens]
MMINNKKNNKNNASNGSNNNNHTNNHTGNKFTTGNDTNVNKKNNATNKFIPAHKNEKPIKTSKEMLTMLIDFKKNNKGLKKPSKEMQEVFQENIDSLIKEKGISPETVKFIIDGYMFNSVDAVEKYFALSQSAKYEMQTLTKYIKADTKNAQTGFKILVAFMSKYCDSNKTVAKRLMPEIIKAINVMAFSREDKNRLNKGNAAVFKSNCFDLVLTGANELYPLDTESLDANDITIFKEVMGPVIALYKNSQHKKDNIKAEKIMKWLGISVEENKEASTDIAEPAEQKQPDKPEVKAITVQNNEDKPFLQNKSIEEIYSLLKNVDNSLSELQGQNTKVLAECSSYQNEIEALKSKIQKQENALSSKEEICNTLNSNLSVLKAELAQQKLANVELTEKYKKLKTEYSKLNELYNIQEIEANKKHREFIVKLGNSLKLSHEDYEMILQMKNGESKASQLQETVQEIFDILKKYDVKIGG